MAKSRYKISHGGVKFQGFHLELRILHKRSQVERPTTAPQREGGCYNPGAGTWRMGGQWHLHREDLKGHCSSIYIPGNCVVPLHKVREGFTL
jgi:hypothetical protein